MNLDTVVLDVDGTLVDSVYVHVAAWRAAFAEVGVDVPTYRIHRAIGMGGDRLVGEVAGAATERAVGDAVRERHGHHFEERFGQVTALDGAADLLQLLRERGTTVVVASSGEQEQTDRLLELVGNADLLHERVSGSEAESSKPAPDLIEVALERVGADSALVVGDAVWDVESARKAGVPCVGLLTGGFSADELREAGAAEVLATPRDLVERFDEVVERVRARST
ncbi:HAD family hydrolase [Nocardioides sp. MAHUQ-72]|uniref:HAD family hydrolase n=1 Tax=unclassified Nocardioides TaxID=2615069 RepID=UPI003612F93D